MNFFTREWVHGNMTDEKADAVAPAYQRHLQAINLPQSVQDLANLNPHDAYILDIDHDPAAATLRFRCGDLQVGYVDAELNFSGMTIPPDHLAMLIKAKRPAQFEVLYDEVVRFNHATLCESLNQLPGVKRSSRFDQRLPFFETG